jgi:hypothetical protein
MGLIGLFFQMIIKILYFLIAQFGSYARILLLHGTHPDIGDDNDFPGFITFQNVHENVIDKMKNERFG